MKYAPLLNRLLAVLPLALVLAAPATARCDPPAAPAPQQLSDAQLAKLSPPLRRAVTDKTADKKPIALIVQFQEDAAADVLDSLQKAGARIRRRYSSLPMAAIEAPGTALGSITALKSVTRVSLDGPLRSAARR